MQTFVEYEKRDLVIGAFVILALIAIVSAVFVKLRWDTGYYRVRAEFSHISTISEATKVRLRGYEIGYVERIRFRPVPVRPNVYFEVDLAIRKEYPLPRGTCAEIRGGGLLGDRFIELEVPETAEGRLGPGEAIPGTLPDDLGETLGRAREMLRSVTRLARRLDNADIGGNFRVFVTHVRRIRDGVERLSRSGTRAFRTMDLALDDMRPELQRALVQLNDNLGHAGSFLSSADTVLLENRQQIRSTLETVHASLTSLQSLVTSIDSLTTDGKQDVLQSIKNLQEASNSLKDLAKHPWKFLTGRVE